MIATCFSPGFLHNKTDRHDITEILLKVALITINLTKSILTVNGSMYVKYFSV